MLRQKTIIFICVILFGVLTAGIGYADMTERLSITQQEEPVNASINNITLEPMPVSNDGFRLNQISYKPKIEYDYTYANQTFDGVKYLRAKRGNMSEVREEVEKEYKKGEGITVYVRENDPSISYIEQAESYNSHVLIVIGSIITIFTLVLANRSRKS